MEAVDDKKEEKALEIRNTIPVVADLHKRIYEAASAPGALEMGEWHTCDKTHCRAGWTVTLAGEAGRKLESFFNTELTAMMIYDASCPGFKIHPARFFDDNDVALADMKKLASPSSQRDIVDSRALLVYQWKHGEYVKVKKDSCVTRLLRSEVGIIYLTSLKESATYENEIIQISDKSVS